MDYLVMFKGLEMSEEEKREEVRERVLFRIGVQMVVERIVHETEWKMGAVEVDRKE